MYLKNRPNCNKFGLFFDDMKMFKTTTFSQNIHLAVCIFFKMPGVCSFQYDEEVFQCREWIMQQHKQLL